MKPYLTEYKDIEARVMTAIQERFNLPVEFWHHPEVKRADRVLFLTEARDLLGPHPAPWGIDDPTLEPLPEVIVPRDWREAEAQFLKDFWYFTSQRASL